MAGSAKAAGAGDAAVHRATGRGWSEWLAILDEAGAEARSHREIARPLHEDHGLSGWWSQTVTVGSEQARGRRRRHERPNGESRTHVVVEHGRLPDLRAAERMKRQWKSALERLQAYLKG